MSRAAAAGFTALAIANAAACADGSNPTRDLFAAVGAGPQVAETPDFVASSRPQSLDYMPVGTSQPGRSTPAWTPEEIKAAEAELDTVRARNEAKGSAAAKLGGTPPPEPVVIPRPSSNRTR